ncbi:alpha/beta hydrolase [Saccharopolyspora hirsuta]|uniref:alpha/beta hydrolase n=1 Tax=Saccharopolyspora hirsuta TaxID=1837 RepID=UPI0014790644|nr:alpha/beta hydrolase [Saccharopolyspora hirsuta]
MVGAHRLNAADQIEGSVLLHHDGVGHGQHYHSPCVTDHVNDSVTTLRTPEPDTTANRPGG